jgi:hypothetical protein
VIDLLHEAAAPGTNGASQPATPIELLIGGVVFTALGVSALVFRTPLWNIYQGMARPMGPAMSRFQYFISCLLVPAIFAVMGLLAFVSGIVRI